MLKAYAAVVSSTQIAEETTSELVGLIEMVVTRIPLWIAAAIVMVVAFVIARLGRSIVENKLAEKGIDEEHQELQILGGRMTYAGLLTMGITIALKIAGIDLTTIIAAVAFGIGFALKDLIMNFLAGIFILLSQHFTIGDFIKIGGTIGKVVEIQSRTTVLQAIDGTKVIVPNAQLFKKSVTSFTSNPFRRIEIIVGVDFRTNLDNAVKVCMKAVKGTKGVLGQPSPAVLVSDFADSAISLKVRAWVNSKGGWLKVKSELAMNLKKELDEHNITIPWPIRTVAYDKDQEKVEEIMAKEEAERTDSVKITSQTQVSPQPQLSPQPRLAPEAVAVQAAQHDIDDEQPLHPLGEQR